MNLETTVVATREILGKIVQVYGSFKDPLFLAQDVAEWIGVANVSQMVSALDDVDKLVYVIHTTGQRRSVLMLTEDGLYEVLMLSRKPIAKKWKIQVKQILKELRIYGITATSQKIEELLSDPDSWIKVLQTIKKEREEKEKAIETVNILNEKIKTDQPKIVFADSVSGSNGSILIRQFAKDLCDNGFNIGQNRLFQWFRDNKYLNQNNEPYQEYVDMRLFEVITRAIGSGEATFTIKTTKITGKGQIYFASKIKQLVEI